MNYRNIAQRSDRGRARLAERAPRSNRLHRDSPALELLTDFHVERPVTVSPDRQIDAALQDMIHSGVRALLVIRRQEVIGLVTSYDIQGERPAQFLQGGMCSKESCLRRDVLVEDIMTPWPDVPSVSYANLGDAVLGDVEATFEQLDATHLVVVEAAPQGTESVVRGLLSRSQLARNLYADESTAIAAV